MVAIRYAVTLGSTTDYEGPTLKIENGFKFRVSMFDHGLTGYCQPVFVLSCQQFVITVAIYVAVITVRTCTFSALMLLLFLQQEGYFACMVSCSGNP